VPEGILPGARKCEEAHTGDFLAFGFAVGLKSNDWDRAAPDKKRSVNNQKEAA
jgi:hypothetical protein